MRYLAFPGILCAAGSLFGEARNVASSSRTQKAKHVKRSQAQLNVTEGRDTLKQIPSVKKNVLSFPLLKTPATPAYRAFSNTNRTTQDHRAAKAQQIDALYQGYGTHYVDLWCGTLNVKQ